jgi:hypothetical protein
MTTAYTIAASSAARFTDQRTCLPAARKSENVASLITAIATKLSSGSRSQSSHAKIHVAASVAKYVRSVRPRSAISGRARSAMTVAAITRILRPAAALPR